MFRIIAFRVIASQVQALRCLVAGPSLAMPCAIHELGGCAAGSNLAFGWHRDVNLRDAKICLRFINRFFAPVDRVDIADNYKLWTVAGRGLAFAGGSVRLSRFCLQARRYACICQRSGQIRHGGWFVSSPSSASSFSSSSYSSSSPSSSSADRSAVKRMTRMDPGRRLDF